jgi:hypothetical protein
VHVARNPLDTLASMQEKPFPLTLPADLEGRVALYLRYNRAALDFAAAHPDQCRCIIYEELVRAPERILRALMNWCGEAFEVQQLAFNGMPQQVGLEDPKVGLSSTVRTDSVGRWRTILTGEEARVIWRATGEIWSMILSSQSRV